MNARVPNPAIALRPDLAAIAELIEPGARVLDVGCGDGALLEHLMKTKRVDGRGLELLQQNVNACVTRGLSVMQGDADSDLVEYPSQVFDVAILSNSIQETFSPSAVLRQLLRIGRHAIISLPNFGHWRIRLSLALKGRMPRTQALDYPWHETPNIHLCTIADFVSLAREIDAEIERAIALGERGRTHPMNADAWGPNLFAEGAIFQLRAR